LAELAQVFSGRVRNLVAFRQGSIRRAAAQGEIDAMSVGETARARARDGTEIYYAKLGDPTGPPVFLGPHCYASALEGRPTGDAPLETSVGWAATLADRFRLIVADYPRGVGRTGNALGRDYTAAVAVEDFNAILDAAQIGRVAFVGYSYGGAFGVQVACRTDRLSAVAIGGWPPLEAPFGRLAEIVSGLATHRPEEIHEADQVLGAAVGFYESLVDWPEYSAIRTIEIPRLAFMGTADAFDAPNPTLSDRLRETEDDLRSLGWEIAWIGGADHLEAMDARASGPFVRAFLERHLC
jgi:pimeloyl-ACP methyl ester carboxylesterase